MDMKLGFLASHEGSNVKAILENIENGSLDAEPKVVISNNLDLGVLNLAKSKGIPNCCLNAKESGSLDDAILETLHSHDVNLVILAGYMKPIGEKIINAYSNRILNIHPALLPKYGGKGMYGEYVHRAVLESNDKETGVTVHIVSAEYDKGPILAQCRVPRYPDDTVKTLSERVLQFEHVLYSQVLRDIQLDLINLEK